MDDNVHQESWLDLFVRVYLVHHAHAVNPGVDAQRPLSPRGVAQARELADRAKALGCAPSAIWHSGKLRSRQTAEAFYRACSPMAEFKMVLGLRPDDPPQHVRDLLVGEGRDVLMVGHMPSIQEILQTLTNGEQSGVPLNSMIALEREGDSGPFTRIWVLTPSEGQ
jgi:phosphohistidine phosphatase